MNEPNPAENGHLEVDPESPEGGLMAGAAAVAGQSEVSAAEAERIEGGPDGAPAGEEQQGTGPEVWRGMVEMTLPLIFGPLEDATEPFSDGERRALVDAWSNYLGTLAAAPGPFTQALIVTGIAVGPRFMQAREAAQDRRREEDAQHVDASFVQDNRPGGQ